MLVEVIFFIYLFYRVELHAYFQDYGRGIQGYGRGSRPNLKHAAEDVIDVFYCKLKIRTGQA